MARPFEPIIPDMTQYRRLADEYRRLIAYLYSLEDKVSRLERQHGRKPSDLNEEVMEAIRAKLKYLDGEDALYEYIIALERQVVDLKQENEQLRQRME